MSTDTPEFHNVPPWDYQPQGLLNWELREGPRLISSGASVNLDAIARHVSMYFLPPRFDTIFRLWDMEDQLILGWCNRDIIAGTQDILGVRAVFEALEPYVDQLLLFGLERVANPKAYIDG